MRACSHLSAISMALVLAALLACKGEEAKPEPPAPQSVGAGAAMGPVQASGGLDFLLTPHAAGAGLRVGLVDYELVLRGAEVELKQGGVLVNRATKELDRIKLRGADGATVTHKLKFKTDGKLELEDGAGARLHVAKPKDYGYKIYDANDTVLVSVKQKEKRVEAKAESGEEVWRVEGARSIKAASVLGFERLELPARVALMYLVSQTP